MKEEHDQSARGRFLAERSTCVGGSDIHHLVQLKPYGCRRRLWYDKAGVPADFPFAGNPATRRGTAMEPHAAADFEVEHPDLQLCHEVPFRVLAGKPWVGVHADRLAGLRVLGRGGRDAPWRGPAVRLLEIECPGARNYYAGKNADQPPNHKKLQAVYGAGIWGLDKATVQWFSSDAWRSRFWDIDCSHERGLFNDLVEAASDFWSTVESPEPPYERLEDGDRRCDACPWRGKCKGLGADSDDGLYLEAAAGDAPLVLGCTPEEADRLLLDYVASKSQLATAKAAHETAKAEIMGLFPRPGRVELPSGKMSLVVVRRKGYTPKPVEPTSYPRLTVTPLTPVEADDVEIQES